MANNGLAYVFDTDGESCYGQDERGRHPAPDRRLRRPARPSAGPGGRPSRRSPTWTGPGSASSPPPPGSARALDVALPEYQPTGQDFIAAWSVPGGGQLRPGFPQAVNDLQFLTGPSVADLDGAARRGDRRGNREHGPERLQRRRHAGCAGWPKLTTDWTVANPMIGSFGTLDTAASARKAVISETRSGYINAYSTGAPACSPSTWPRFHHDNANSGDYGRDATLPGKPFGAQLDAPRRSPSRRPATTCSAARADHYQVVTSNAPINEANFAGGRSPERRPRAGQPRRHPDLRAAGRRDALRRDPRRRRSGQRRPPGDRGSRLDSRKRRERPEPGVAVAGAGRMDRCAACCCSDRPSSSSTSSSTRRSPRCCPTTPTTWGSPRRPPACCPRPTRPAPWRRLCRPGSWRRGSARGARCYPGSCCSALASLVFGFAQDVVLLDAARFVQGVAGALAWAGALTWLILATPQSRRGSVIGDVLGIAIAGALLGPGLGALAAEVGTEPVFSSVLVLTVALSLAALAHTGAGARRAASPARGAGRRSPAPRCFARPGTWRRPPRCSA